MDLKRVKLLVFLISRGTAFQRRGAERLKALLPMVLRRARGTVRWREEEDLRAGGNINWCREVIFLMLSPEFPLNTVSFFSWQKSSKAWEQETRWNWNQMVSTVIQFNLWTQITSVWDITRHWEEESLLKAGQKTVLNKPGAAARRH